MVGTPSAWVGAGPGRAAPAALEGRKRGGSAGRSRKAAGGSGVGGRAAERLGAPAMMMRMGGSLAPAGGCPGARVCHGVTGRARRGTETSSVQGKGPSWASHGLLTPLAALGAAGCGVSCSSRMPGRAASCSSEEDLATSSALLRPGHPAQRLRWDPTAVTSRVVPLGSD